MISTSDFSKEIKEKGWVKFHQVLSKDTVTEINNAIDPAYENCRRIQITNGVATNTDGTVHHVLCQGSAFLEFIKQLYLDEYIFSFFSSPYILNSFGAIINIKNKLSYVGNIHRDIRTFYNVPMMINMLVMLDDFTLENGATYFLTGSNNNVEEPEKKFFYDNAERATGKAGDIILFDSLVWHAAGENTTDNVRRALTLTFTRPFMKQQLDYPRCIGYDKMNEFSEGVKQVLGYNARVPANLNEWYQPVETRFYKRNQG